MKLYEINYKPHLKRRILATLIDYSIYGILFFIYVYCIGQETSSNSWEVTGLPALPVFLFWLVYFPGLEAINQATPGHDILKLRVIKSTGERITFTDAFKRRICDMFEIGMWGLPAMICISKTDKNQRIGDLFAGTVVVKKEDVIETEFSIR